MRRRLSGLWQHLATPVPRWALILAVVVFAITEANQDYRLHDRVDGLQHEVEGLYAEIDLAASRPVVRIVERIGGQTRVIKVCDGDSVLKALNEVKRSQALSGEGSAGNRGEGRVGLTGADSAHASGDTAAATSQFANASSGDAIIGQDLDLVNLCGTQVVTATNQVSDSTAITGDAEAENRSEQTVGTVASSSPSPSEPVEGAESDSPSPAARTASPPPLGSPSPLPAPSPVP